MRRNNLPPVSRAAGRQCRQYRQAGLAPSRPSDSAPARRDAAAYPIPEYKQANSPLERDRHGQPVKRLLLCAGVGERRGPSRRECHPVSSALKTERLQTDEETDRDREVQQRVRDEVRLRRRMAARCGAGNVTRPVTNEAFCSI